MKLYGGVILNCSLVKKNMFTFKDINGDIEIKTESDIWQKEALEILENFFSKANVNLTYIKNLTYSLSFEVFNGNK